MKNARQTEIMDIIRTTEVETQEQLLAQLRKRGFNATQATISRDIKELRLVKEMTGQGQYRYALSEHKSPKTLDLRLRNIFKEGVLSVDLAQNLVVVKTMPGLASAACSALDGMDIPGMVGSLAGDDTGILIMQDNSAAQQFRGEVHKLLKN
ncbi:MAG: arginine repressor [Lawsonibacter sp.]|nr:arginine repressor [Lawsonibacter sp.]